MTVREGRCWFVMDLKSFDLSVEVVGGKLRGIIEEKGRGLSTWIRFRVLSLHYLLEGVKAYYRGEVVASWNMSWEEGTRKFKLEQHSNEVGRFLLCSILTKEAKRF